MKLTNQKGSMGTTILIIVVLVIVIAAIWYWVKGPSAQTPSTNSAAATQADVQSIEKDLSTVDTSATAETQAIDTAVKGR